MPRTKQTRRGNREGAIWQKNKGGWAGQVVVGEDSNTGKLIRKTVYGKRRQDVLAKIDKIKNDLKAGVYIKSSDETLGQWLVEWHEGRKGNIAESTWDWYKYLIYEHILPLCENWQGENFKLQELTTRDIQRLLNIKLKTLSSSTVHRIYGVLNKSLKQAVKEKKIVRNPVEDVEPPKVTNKKPKTFTKEELNKFLEASKNYRYDIGFFLGATLGLRRGEILGLKWEDIDFERMTISIKRQYVKEGMFKEPKTAKSYGTIKIYPYIRDKLKNWKIRQEKEKKTSDNYQDNNLVLATKNGQPISPRNFDRSFASVLKKAKLDSDMRVHDLRHTFATLALENGVDLKMTQSILRHSRLSTTGDMYSHVTEKLQVQTAKKLQKLFTK
ncbi:MAG: site-specific integrase [Methanofastidiosum sp.]